ncbi:MAG: hypothetical protein HRT72_05025 [Flavobacteriales bacterium]|nr:hypothetical protein [Flavobacteriales bacterium]
MGTTTNITGLCQGIYIFKVTSSGGISIDSISINEPLEILITTSSTNSSCGQSDGSAFVTSIQNFAGYYISDWGNGMQGDVISGVSAGLYTVMVTDLNGCSTSSTTSIYDNPGPTISIQNIWNTNCYNGCDGYVDFLIYDGTAPYSITVDGQPYIGLMAIPQYSYSNLCAGSHELIITDANGCTDIAVFDILEPDEFTISTTATPASSASNSDGTATANIVSGTGPAMYVWNDANTQLAQTASMLSTGDYCVTVVNSYGCEAISCTFVDFTTSLNDFGGNEIISVYGKQVQINSSPDEVQINTITGQLVHYAKVSGSSHSVELETGAYIVTVRVQRQEISKQIYIQ